MEQTAILILGLLVALLLADSVRGFFRMRALHERTNQICGFDEQADDGDAPGGVDTGLAPLLEGLGIARGKDAIRIYVVLAPIALAVTIASLGWKSGTVAAFGLIGGLIAFAKWRGARRTREFADRLPAFLERTRRLVMTGNTLPQAFVEAVANADPVLKREIDPFVRRIRHGASFPDSIEMLARKNDIVELHMLAAYVKSNAKFGGRVAQTLANLIAQLGNKRRLDREIRAATAETRASAAILCGLMAFLVIIMSVVNSEYVAFFFGSNKGRLIFSAIVAWPAIGIVVMKRILTLDF